MRIVVDSYSLSPLQEGLLFNALFAPHSGVDVTQIMCRMHHPVEPSAFRHAWETAVARHTILRTAFRWEGLTEPVQEVHDGADLEYAVEDLRGFAPDARRARLENHLRDDRHRGFDISRPPLTRVAVFILSDAETVLVWTLHHLILDAPSFAMILKEVFAIYEAALGGREAVLDTPRPYRAYIDWLRTQDVAAAERYWRDVLRGYTSPPSLSVVHDPRNLSKTAGRYDKRKIVLPPALGPVLKKLAAENGLTLYTCFQAAWAVLLSRYAGSPDVVWAGVRGCRGVPVEGADSIPGLFINTLPVRARIDEEQPVVEFLRELRAQHVATRAFEHSPLARIQRWSEITPGMPLFNSLMNYQSRPWNALLDSLGGEYAKREWDVLNQTNIPLSFDIYEQPELRIVADYDAALFDGAAMDAMLGHFRTLLEGIAADPNRAVGALPMLTDAERATILVEWNRTEAGYPRDKTIHALIEEQATRLPGAAAVSLGTVSISYGELNERANRLAHWLRKRGIGTGTPVAVCMDRTIDMVIALVGTLKTGGAYVPMDPSYPRERLAFMLEDTNAPVLITESAIVGNLPAHRAHTIRLDADWDTVAGEPRGDPESGGGPDDWAYIIYTSGSTGRPKGVCCRHRSVLNLLADFTRRAPVGAGDRCALWTSVSFDVSVYEIFSALTAGAALCISSDAVRFESAAFLEWMNENRITSAYLPPLMLADMLAWIEEHPLALPLKRLLVGVEPISEKLLASMMERTPGLAIINGYGPTETTICATLYDVRPETARDRHTPIGKPVQNSTVYVLDPFLRPVPPGVRGEIYIGGEGLAHGYFNRPELTAERFVADPFAAAPGRRLYRTGDTARRLGDGTIEFIGRIDYQVKVRGFRVEPGEVEAILSRHPWVKESVVIAKSDRSGAKRLIAYIVTNKNASGSVADLRSFLKEALPDYMVPSAFVTMDLFPLTPNGKLDRAALPEPEISRADLQSSYVAPRDEIEMHLSQIWERVIGITPIGITDNFFDLGGHSLLAVRLFAETAKVFDVNIPLAAIFQSPTVGEIAAIIREKGRARAGESLVAIQPRGTKPPLFFVHAYGGGVFFYRELSDALGADQPFYGLQSVGLDGRRCPHTTVEDMAAHYIGEIKRVQPAGPYYIGGRCLGAYVAFEMANQLRERGDTVGLLAILDSYWMPQEGGDGRRGLAVHLKRMSERGFREKLSYIREYAGYRVIRTKLALTERLSALCFRVGQPIPGFMKDFYLNIYIPEVNARAERNYSPAIYPGIITFFQATSEEERDPRMFWGKLTSEGLDVRMVPATHKDILVDPNVKVLAEKLNAALREAQSVVK